MSTSFSMFLHKTSLNIFIKQMGKHVWRFTHGLIDGTEPAGRRLSLWTNCGKTRSVWLQWYIYLPSSITKLISMSFPMKHCVLFPLDDFFFLLFPLAFKKTSKRNSFPLWKVCKTYCAWPESELCHQACKSKPNWNSFSIDGHPLRRWNTMINILSSRKITVWVRPYENMNRYDFTGAQIRKTKNSMVLTEGRKARHCKINKRHLTVAILFGSAGFGS